MKAVCPLWGSRVDRVGATAICLKGFEDTWFRIRRFVADGILWFFPKRPAQAGAVAVFDNRLNVPVMNIDTRVSVLKEASDSKIQAISNKYVPTLRRKGQDDLIRCQLRIGIVFRIQMRV